MDRSEFSYASLRLCVRHLLAKAQSCKATDRNRKLKHSLLRFALAIFLFALVSFSIFFIHSYRSYAEIVDARLARGYLTSRAGIYAAPRTLRAGQKVSRDGLAAALRRAGYIDGDDASEVWNGSFAVHSEAIEIRPNNTSGFPSVVNVTFDRDGRINSLTGDDINLDSFTLEPEPLTNDAAMKSG
ncbi:MAG TPA: hypothetical protein VHD88_03800, partial [Pyrinomonadaceae bacterium]|nr:hypothetical protein [Pyrinomonadaceae bacterium]